jgi:hypothetical protein
MANDNILYIPIQINGDGETKPTSLLDRELYVLDNGTLYVGKKQPNGSITVTEIAGRVIDDATINNPTIINGTIRNAKIKPTVYPSVDNILNPETGVIYFIDEGNFGNK